VADAMTTAARTGRPRRSVKGGSERRITAISSDHAAGSRPQRE
jgi:hypothetical protein